MNTDIVVAVIGAVGTVTAAALGIWASRRQAPGVVEYDLQTATTESALAGRPPDADDRPPAALRPANRADATSRFVIRRAIRFPSRRALLLFAMAAVLLSTGIVLVSHVVTRSDNFGLVFDGGFEQQRSDRLSWPWSTEGPDGGAVDRGLRRAHSGANNAVLRSTGTSWNAMTQPVSVTPYTSYQLEVWVQTSGNYREGYLGVRGESGSTPRAETRYGSETADVEYRRLTVTFDSGTNNSVTVFVGYWAPGGESWTRIDDISLRRA